MNDMTDSLITIAKSFLALITTSLLPSLGIYESAFIISFIAANVRLVTYHSEKSWRLLLKFFITGSGVTMLMVHVGHMNEWGYDKTILYLGIAAFLSGEIIEALLVSKDAIIKKLTAVIKL